jgi:hypothetical protein
MVFVETLALHVAALFVHVPPLFPPLLAIFAMFLFELAAIFSAFAAHLLWSRLGA